MGEEDNTSLEEKTTVIEPIPTKRKISRQPKPKPKPIVDQAKTTRSEHRSQAAASLTTALVYNWERARKEREKNNKWDSILDNRLTTFEKRVEELLSPKEIKQLEKAAEEKVEKPVEEKVERLIQKEEQHIPYYGKEKTSFKPRSDPFSDRKQFKGTHQKAKAYF